MNQIIDTMSFLVAAIAFVVSLVIYYHLSGAWDSSLFGSIVSAAMIWIGYITLRLIYLAMKK